MSKSAAKKLETPSEPPIVILDAVAMRVFPYGGGKEQGGNIVQFDKHRIHPGFNKPVSGAVWDVVSSHASYVQWLAQGTFCEFESVSEIADLAVDPILKNSSSKAGIEWWLERETRGPVREKLEEKLANIHRRRQHTHDAEIA